MNFEESYLIPKTLYEKLRHNETDTTPPDDVAIKQKDYAYRFKLGKSHLNLQEENPSALILDSINDSSKRLLAAQILHFIHSRGGGSIKWGEDYIMIIDGTRYEELDAREVFRRIVGEIEDPAQTAYPVYIQLKKLQAPYYFLRFYDELNNQDDQWFSFDKKEKTYPEDIDLPDQPKSPMDATNIHDDPNLSTSGGKKRRRKKKKQKQERLIETRSNAQGLTRSGHKWINWDPK